MAEDKAVDVEVHEEEAPDDWENMTEPKSEGKSMGMSLWKKIKANLLLTLTLVGVVLGIFFGGILRNVEPSPRAIKAIGLPGDVLVRLLKMLVLPLIVSSLISGLTSLDTKSCGKLGARALVYYFTTSCIAVVIGIVVVFAIRPGKPVFKDHDIKLATKDNAVDALESVVDILRNLFPSNLVQACFQQATSFYGTKDNMILEANSSLGYTPDCKWENATKEELCHFVKNGTVLDVTKGFKDGMNVLGILVFAIPFGILLNRMGARGRVMVEFFEILSELSMQLVYLVLWYSPLGIMSLICSKILAMESLAVIMPTLGLFILTVILGLVIHLAVLMTIFYSITRKNPLTFFEGILQAWLTAFATASSGATLPVTLHCLEENIKVDRRVTRFVLPIGATVNMDGTALFAAVGTIFIGQLNGYRLGFVRIITISITATLGSIGAASIPSAGIVTLVLVLTAVNFPVEEVSLIMAVDWFLDRSRTSVNVVSDSYGAGTIYHLSEEELK